MSEKLYQHTLNNGLTLLAQPMESVESASFHFLLPAGAAQIPAGCAGAGAVLTDWLFRGAGPYDTRRLIAAMDSLGLDRHSGVSADHAYYAARDVLAPIALTYRNHGWSYAVGTSGTAKALAQLAEANFGSDGLDRAALASIEGALLKAGHADRLRLEGLRADRRPVLAGGLAVMSAVFDELGIERMRYCPAALRQGVLYDLLGRGGSADVRELTVAHMVRRYSADPVQGQRVGDTALALFDQGARAASEELAARRELLRWAARLAEIGVSIAHEDFHKHSAYILSYADMPGFSQQEQRLMSLLALGHVGGLRKLRELVATDLDWLMVLCLRVSSILHRRRDTQELPLPALFFKRRRLRIEVPGDWARKHPLSDETLASEADAWNELGVFERFEYVRI